MKKLFTPLLLILVTVSILLPATASAAGPQWVVVNWGDTLFSIANRYGTNVSALMSANGLPNANFIYAGQRLMIPSGNNPKPPVVPGAPGGAVPAYYTVHAGDTLFGIASRFGVSTAAIAQANRLWNYDFIFTGQVLKIPGGATSKPPASQPSTPGTPPQPSNPGAGKWIDINISTQRITAYEGNKSVYSALVSTGVAIHPTVVGRFKVYAKYSAYTMSGGTRGVDYYYLPNVPWTMFFYSGYAIHGTYWHHNFGHPMSHGCVNLSISDAKWFYDWSPVGTTVVTHY